MRIPLGLYRIVIPTVKQEYVFLTVFVNAVNLLFIHTTKNAEIIPTDLSSFAV